MHTSRGPRRLPSPLALIQTKPEAGRGSVTYFLDLCSPRSFWLLFNHKGTRPCFPFVPIKSAIPQSLAIWSVNKTIEGGLFANLDPAAFRVYNSNGGSPRDRARVQFHRLSARLRC